MSAVCLYTRQLSSKKVHLFVFACSRTNRLLPRRQNFRCWKLPRK